MFKKSALICALAVAAPFAAQAADGVLTFEGAVLSSTCSVMATAGSGVGGNKTVTLPNVTTDQLGTTGNTAGETPFIIKVGGSGCVDLAITANSNSTYNTTAKAKGFEVFFDPTNSSGVTGDRLNNTGTANNVLLELFQSAGISSSNVASNTSILLSKQTPGQQGATPVSFASTASSTGPQEATASFMVRYYAQQPVTAGDVKANIAYTIVYK